MRAQSRTATTQPTYLGLQATRDWLRDWSVWLIDLGQAENAVIVELCEAHGHTTFEDVSTICRVMNLIVMELNKIQPRFSRWRRESGFQGHIYHRDTSNAVIGGTL